MNITWTITVLEECLESERAMLKISSKGYAGLNPVKGMEKQFLRQQNKCKALMELIRAMKSEPVKAAVANWEQLMEAAKESVMVL